MKSTDEFLEERNYGKMTKHILVNLATATDSIKKAIRALESVEGGKDSLKDLGDPVSAGRTTKIVEQLYGMNTTLYEIRKSTRVTHNKIHGK